MALQGVTIQPNLLPEKVGPPTSVKLAELPEWSWCSPVWAAISLFCCPLFGCIATLCAGYSYVDFKTGDYPRSDFKRRCSWGFSITSLIIGIILLATGLSLLWSTFSAIGSLFDLVLNPGGVVPLLDNDASTPNPADAPQQA